MAKRSGGFTLPGEAGYEELTLTLAEAWGADAIRDSDGTELSPKLLKAGYDIYSTVCVIREHNDWLALHPGMQQQCILCTAPEICVGAALRVDPMRGFFGSQFKLNDTPDGLRYWQVYDRTTNTELPCDRWHYDAQTREVVICGARWHKYTVSFFVWRVWEEISMYNHTTNHWDAEHLRQIDPVYPESRAYLRDWFQLWCERHPHTGVVRFTSLFYNFVWIWGSDARNRDLFTDWSSYDFAASPLALDLFASEYGYRLTAEDFVSLGLRSSGHTVPGKKKRDWMAFVSNLVISAGRELVDIAHAHGKKAYVFYDDSWIGLEPYNGRFTEFHFDGIIKCVFSGFEARLCANVPCQTHEIRLHPYLFPVGLGGAPTFEPGGEPARDARRYWKQVRRALLRQPMDRIGLGGYLHLVEEFPEFTACIAAIADEFRAIRDLHASGAPHCLGPRVAVLHAWGNLRAWTLSGHFHETDAHDLIHVLESLSGLPLDVRFLSFEDIAGGVPEDVDIIVSAGQKGTAWSGGVLWADDAVVEALTAWVHGGGALLGIGEPGALDGYDTALRISHLLGVDIDDGRYACHGRWTFSVDEAERLIPEGATFEKKPAVRLTGAHTRVLAAQDGMPMLTGFRLGEGMGLYLPGYRYSEANARLLQNVILYATGQPVNPAFTTDNPLTECTWFPQSRKLAIVNNTSIAQKTAIQTQAGPFCYALEPFEIRIIAF